MGTKGRASRGEQMATRREADPRGSDQRFRALFAHAPVGVALSDQEGVFVDSNTAFRDIVAGTGVDPDDGRLLDLTRHLPDDAEEASRWRAELDAVSAGQAQVAQVQLPLTPPDGVLRLVRATTARVTLGEQPYLLTHLEDATGRRLPAQRVVHLATHDAVTSLANRELVQQRLVAALERAATTRLPVAVISIDLDHADDLVARHGEAAVDPLLSIIGARLRDVLRAGDCAGRTDGEQFLVVACDVADETAMAELVKRLEQSLAEPITLRVRRRRVGTVVRPNLGAVLSRFGEPPVSVLRRAEAARYADRRARRRGDRRTG